MVRGRLMAAHVFVVPVEEFLSASWGAIALTVGIVFAAASLLISRALRQLERTGGKMRARVGQAVAHERPHKVGGGVSPGQVASGGWSTTRSLVRTFQKPAFALASWPAPQDGKSRAHRLLNSSDRDPRPSPRRAWPPSRPLQTLRGY